MFCALEFPMEPFDGLGKANVEEGRILFSQDDSVWPDSLSDPLNFVSTRTILSATIFLWGRIRE